MQIVPDFSEASEEQKPVPTGIYKARIVGVDPKESKAGNKMLNWKFSIFGAEGAYVQYNNRWVSTFTMVEGRGAFKLRQYLKAILGNAGQFDTEELIGKEVEISVVERLNDDGTVSNFPDIKSVKSL